MSEEQKTVALTTINEPPRQAPPQQLQLQIQVTPQGVQLQFPINLGLDNEMMKQLIKTYLAQHPELVQEIAREALAQKQQELQFLQAVKHSRND